MNELEAVRSRLITLQETQAEESIRLLDIADEQLKLERERLAYDQKIAVRRAAINTAKKDLERAETRAAAREQAIEVGVGMSELESAFKKKAKGRNWDEGLLQHQWIGACFGAVAKRWLLGDGVGLGKTRTTIAWLDLIEAKRVLIVCEAGIVNQFAGEVMDLAPHREVVNLYRKKPLKGRTWADTRHILLDELQDKPEAVVLINFEAWRKDKDILAKLMDYRFDTIIVDEAHNLKSTRTVNFNTIKSLIDCDNVCGGCAKPIKGLWDPEKLREVPSKKVARPCPSCGWKFGDRKRVEHANPLTDLLVTKSVKNVCLTTGTPMLNSPVDLYALLHLLDPIMFKSQASFESTFLALNQYSGKWEFRAGGLANLKPLIEGRFLARTRGEAGVVLPEQAVRVVRVDIDKENYPLQYRTIKQVSEAAQIVLSNGKGMTILALIALITRKRQANVWPGGIVIKDTNKDSPTYGEVLFSVGEEVRESAKMDAAIDKIKELHANGQRQLVFSQFSTACDEMAERLGEAGLRVATLTGATPAVLRDRIKSNFDRSKGEPVEWDILVANYKAGGTGLNMNAATATHILDEEWNPGKRDQAYGRTDRIGQVEESEVFVYRVPGSIDTWMSNIITYKEGIINGFEEEMQRGEGADLTAKALFEAIGRGEVL